jgi:YidC/Oxa1 family membrane protein insertase
MNARRLIVYLIVAMLGVFVWRAWQHDYPPVQSANPVTSQAEPPATAGSSIENGSSTYVPSAPTASTSPKRKHLPTTPKITQDSGELVQVKTDVFEAKISLEGGNLVSVRLLKYPAKTKQIDNPVEILSNTPGDQYVAESGLTGTSDKGKVTFSAAKKEYMLGSGDSELQVVLTGKTTSGLKIIKTYTFKRDRYAVNVGYAITNTASSEWSGSLYTQFLQHKRVSGSSGLYSRSYTGGAISSPETPYQKIKYKEMKAGNLSKTHVGGWVAFQQQYFLSAWIPGKQGTKNHFYTHVISTPNQDDVYVIGLITPQVRIQPGSTTNTSATIYVGPEIAKRLQGLAPGLDHTIDYGWLWPVSVLIFWLMNKIHSLLGNWGWAIIFTTIIIKMGFYWFSATSFRSMAKMREIQPKLKALKERYADDKPAFSKATMELYKKEKINPLGGCLPILVQIPVFIALYYVLIESVQLRQAPFIFWIQDLSAKDPYYVLPILMGLSMLVQQKLTPASPDPTQAKIMMILPVVFTVFFLNFPSGLVLYWLVNNCVQVLQQWYVMRTFEAHKQKKHAKRKKKK